MYISLVVVVRKKETNVERNEKPVCNTNTSSEERNKTRTTISSLDTHSAGLVHKTHEIVHGTQDPQDSSWYTR